MGFISACLLLPAIVILGCSGPSGEPVSPSGNGLAMASAQSPGEGGHMLWGFWYVRIDPDTLTAQAIPLRGAEFTANVTQFLQPPSSPTNMVSIAVDPASEPSIGHFIVDVTVRHPFPGLNQYRGFDVRGILISNGTYGTESDPALLIAGPDETHLLNADGWTRWWNPTEFTKFNTIFGFTSGKLAPPIKPTATLNGYKYFADGLDAEADVATLDPATRGTFGVAPGVNTRRYDIQFKMDVGEVVFDFNYAVDASWSEPDQSFKPDFPIQAFSLSANCQEAYWMGADFTGSTAWFVNGTQKGGDLHIALEVGHWGALADGVNVPDEVSAIWVESPDLGISPVDVLGSATVSDGNGVSTSVFDFDIVGVKPSAVEDQRILVSVVASSPSNYAPQIPGGGAGFAYPDAPLTAYRFFAAPILNLAPTKQPVVLSIDPTVAGINTGNLPAQINGQDFASNAQVRLEKSNNPAVVLTGVVQSVSPDGSTIHCTFDMDSADGAQLGKYHVKVTNPGTPPLTGQLDNGFEIVPSSTCDQVYDTQQYEGEFNNYAYNIYTGDLAFTKDGKLLIEVNSGGYHIYGFDVTQDGPVDGTPVIQNMMYGGTTIASMDVDDLTGNIIYALAGGSGYDGILDTIVAYKPDGTLIDSFLNANTDHLQAIDTNNDGSIWTVGHTYATGTTNPDRYFINRYTWDSAGETYSLGSSTDATGELAYLPYPVIFDCAISYTDQRLFVFSFGPVPYNGRIDCYDISSGAAIHDAAHSKTNFLPSGVGAHGHYNWRKAGDIEIDHSNPVYEHCRMFICIRHYWTIGESFLKMDTNGNLIDTYTNANANNDGTMYYSAAINPVADDPDGDYLTCIEDNSYGRVPWHFHTYKVPTGW
jgi:hypothetical protein